MSNFKKITLSGADISEFSLFSHEGNKTLKAKVHKFNDVKELIIGKVAEISGKELSVAEEMKDGGHYIVVSMYSFDVNKYTVKLEDGNVYLTGSFLSVDKAVEDFLSLLQREGDAALTEKDNAEGSLGLKVPYTKQDLLDLFKEVYEDDGKFIPGTHTWGTDYGDNNGTDIQQTVDRFKAVGSKVAPLLEIEITKLTPFYYQHKGVEQLTDYDISKLVSEAMKHVSEGGILSVCMHLGNPLENWRIGGNWWYHGMINGDKGVNKIITEGTDLNKGFMKTIDGTLRLMRALAQNGIPFLYRPYHEMNSDWFWWTICQWGMNMSKEGFTNLWKFTYDLVTEKNGIKDILWVYSPSPGGTDDSYQMVSPMYGYPGDDYVDIAGVDWYGGGSGKKTYNPNGNYEALMATGKPIGFCEYGPGYGGPLTLHHPSVGIGYHYKYDCLDILSEVKMFISEGLKVSHIMTWTWHGSLTTLGRVKEFMDDPMTVSREDLAERWAKLHG